MQALEKITYSWALVFILFPLVVLWSLGAKAQVVNIPDTNFKNALLAHAEVIDTNGDGEIQVSEAAAFTGLLMVDNANISDLTGIAAFTSITFLTCENNTLTSLDVSANTALIYLHCGFNDLAHLNVSGCPALFYLGCRDNQLATLDLSNNTALRTLNANYNSFTSLDVSFNTALMHLHCGFSSLTHLDVSANTDLVSLDCMANGISVLDVSSNPALSTLQCWKNSIAVLDLSANPALTFLECSWNLLTDLDVSTNLALEGLGCSNNSLVNLNVRNGNNINFWSFYAQGNPNLACIVVDDVVWSDANWTSVDAGAEFSTNCSLGVGEKSIIPESDIYPNPAITHINIALKWPCESISIYSLTGQLLVQQRFSPMVDISTLNSGIHIIEMSTGGSIVSRKKFVKM